MSDIIFLTKSLHSGCVRNRSQDKLVIPACPESDGTIIYVSILDAPPYGGSGIGSKIQNDSRRAACGGLAGMTVWVV